MDRVVSQPVAPCIDLHVAVDSTSHARLTVSPLAVNITMDAIHDYDHRRPTPSARADSKPGSGDTATVSHVPSGAGGTWGEGEAVSYADECSK